MVNKTLQWFGITLKSFRQKSFVLCMLMALLLCVNKARADSFYWTGNTNTNWNNSGNWYDASNANIFPSYPQAGDIAYIGVNGPFLLIFSYDYFTGPNSPNVNVSSACSQLYIAADKAATLTVSAALNVTNTLYNYSSGTINSTAAITVSANNATVTNAGTIKLTGGSLSLTGNPATFTSSGSFSALSSATFSITGNNSTGTNTGTFTVTNSTFSYPGSAGAATFSNNSPGTFTATSSTIGFAAGSGNTLNNTGTFSLTSSPITFSGGTQTFNNSGTFSAASSSTITLSSNNSAIKSTAGTLTTTGSNIALSGQPTSIQNSGTSKANISGSTITMAQSAYITNAGTGSFTIKGGSSLTFGYASYITNTGTFYAGTSGSACAITMAQQDDAINNNSSGLFYLGSTSTIDLTGYHATVNNASGARFTFQSDANGSAAVGNISGGGSAGLTGYFNIERFLTGGSLSSNRGYRLLSSPVNQTSATTNATNTFNLVYLNQHTFNSVSYAGAFTGGPFSTDALAQAAGFSGKSLTPTVYLYKETIAASNATAYSGKHVAVIKVNAADVNTSNTADATATINNLTIPIGNGFLLYFVGPSTRTSGSSSGTNPTAGPPQDATLTANGYVNQGSFTVNLWYTPAGGTGKLSNNQSFTSAAARGFNMVGNPYPSTLDLSKLYTDNSASIDAVYMLSQRQGGSSQDYVAYSNSGSSAPGYPNYVVSGGGFIVHVKTATSTTSTLVFNESQKAPSTQLTGTSLIMSTPKAEALAVDGKLGANGLSTAQQKLMAMPAQTGSQPITGLYMKMEKDTTVFSYCGIYYDKNYAAKYEEGDAPYISGLSSPMVMASLTSDGVNTAINHLPDYHNGSRVKLNVGAAATGIYHLKMEGVRNIDTLYDIYLVDKLKKDSLDIRRYGVYNFNLNKADTTTFGANRFELSIQRKPLPQYLLTDISGAKVTDGVIVTWKTQNESNYTGFTLERQDKGDQAYSPIYDTQSNGSATYSFVDRLPNPGNNIYRLKQNDVDGRISYSQPVTVFYDKLNANGLINVFPNPTVETINVSMPVNANNKSSYKLNVYNSSGYTVLQRSTSSGNWSENIAGFKPGVYIVEVIKSDGTPLGKVKFIKN